MTYPKKILDQKPSFIASFQRMEICGQCKRTRAIITLVIDELCINNMVSHVGFEHHNQ